MPKIVHPDAQKSKRLTGSRSASKKSEKKLGAKLAKVAEMTGKNAKSCKSCYGSSEYRLSGPVKC